MFNTLMSQSNNSYSKEIKRRIIKKEWTKQMPKPKMVNTKYYPLWGKQEL